MNSPWALTANNKTGSETYAIVPAGNHVAVLVAMVDLGTHSKEFDKTDASGAKTGVKEERDYRQVFLAWELTDEPDPDHKGRNFVLGKEYALALGTRAALRQVVEVWLGRKLNDGEQVEDLSKMLGMKCLLEVVHGQNADKTRTYANLKAVSSVPRKMVVPDANLPAYLFAVGEAFSPPSWLPQWSYGEKLADKMARSHESKAAARAGNGQAAAAVTGDEDDGIPF